MQDPEDEDDHPGICRSFTRCFRCPSPLSYVFKSAKFTIYGSDYFYTFNFCKTTPDFDLEDYYKFREDGSLFKT